MSLINYFRRITGINSLLIKIVTKEAYNLKHVTSSHLKNNINCVRLLSTNVCEASTGSAFGHLDLNFQQKKRIYKSDIISAIEDLEKKGINNDENILFLLRCCGHLVPDELPTERISLAKKMWQTFQNNNVTFNVGYYNALLQCYIENQIPVEHENFLRNMSCKPNERTYHLLLKAVCEQGDITQATKIISKMKENDLPANEHVFSALILGHLRSGDVNSAKSVLSTMKVTHISPTARTYTELLCGYAELNKEYDFVSTLRDAAEYGKFTHRNINAVVRSVSKSGNFKYLSMIKRSFTDIISSRQFQIDFTNFCIHLIYLNKPEAAYKTYVSLINPEIGFLSESDTYASTLIFEMVKAQVEPARVIPILDDLIKTKQNEFAIFKAIECSLRVLNDEMAISLLKELNNRNIKLRNHYFWPLLLQTAQKNDHKGMFEILELMTNLNLSIEPETLETYSLQYLEDLDPDFVIKRLKELKMKVGDILTPVSVVLLRSNRIKDVANLCKNYKIKLDGQSVIKPLSVAFLSSFDVENTIQILKYLSGSRKLNMEYNGQFLIYVIKKSRNVQYKKISHLIKAFKQHNLMITSYNRDRIEGLSRRITDESVKKIIFEYINSSVEHSHLNNINNHIPHPRDMNLEQLECHLIELTNKNMETRGVLRKLIQMHCRVGNLERVNKLLEQFHRSGYKITIGMQAGLLDLYIKNNDVDLSMKTYNEIIQKEPSFVVDEFKVLDLARLLISHNNFNDAVKIIQSEISKRKIQGGKSIEPNCWKLLNTSSVNKNADQTKQLFEILTKAGFCVPSNVLLGPLVRVHLNSNNIKHAVEEYVNCCSIYKETPLQYELLCKLVDTENSTDCIQKVVSATGAIHGIKNAKISLMASLAETGKTNTLKQFLMEQEIDLPSNLIEQHCNRWIKQGNENALKNLVDVKKYLSETSISVIYRSLMQIYYENDDLDNALNLWNELQETDYFIPDSMKKILKILLKNHKHHLANKL